jgi:hypothetical protein
LIKILKIKSVTVKIFEKSFASSDKEIKLEIKTDSGTHIIITIPVLKPA